MALTIASLCSGYGGLEMGLRMWLGDGLEVAWHAEVNEHADRVLKEHWPDVPNLGDFTTPDFWHQAARADVHAGGVPCQPFSAAGAQRGADDERHLWPFWLDGIRRHRPASVVFENVQGLTQGKKRPVFDQIITDLIELGYDVRWCLLGACAVGACHHRHRVFLLACRTRTMAHARQVTVATCGQSAAAYLPTPRAIDGARGSVSRERAEATGRPLDQLSAIGNMLPTPRAKDGTRDAATPERTLRVIAEGRNQGLDLPTALSLFPTPNARDGAGRGQGTAEGNARRVERGHQLNLGDSLVLLPSPRASDGSNGGPNQGITSGDIALSSAVIGERFGKYAAAVARHTEVMGVLPPEPTEIGPRGGRRLAAAFSEWMMMLPAGHVTGALDRSPALERCGNGVVPLQAATALGLLYRDLHASA